MTQTSRILSTQPKSVALMIIELLAEPMEETTIVSHAKSEDVKRKRIECLRFINSAFPFYLPLKQHEMLPSELDYKDREYWGNAIHFLLSNKAHGFPMWKQFQEQVRSMDATVTCRPHISAEKTNLILKHLPRSSDIHNNSFNWDFLSDKLVLVQLPFQPVLLFQWLTSAMHRISTFACMNGLYTNIPFAAKFERQLKRLQEVLKEIHLNIGFLFDYLQHQVESENEIFVGNLELFEKVLKKVLDGITIFYSPEAVNFLKYLAEKTITESWQDERLWKLKKTALPLKERNFVFNLDFWKALPNKDLKIFGSSEEKLVRRVTVKNPKMLTTSQVSTILEKCLKTESVKSLNLEYFMDSQNFLDKVNKLDHIARDYNSLLIKSGQSGQQGSIGDILVANAFSSLQNAKLEMAYLISENSTIPLSVLLDFASPDYDASDIENLFSAISEIKKKPLSLQTMIRDLLDEIFLSNVSDSFNNNKQNTVNLFEKKIKEIILSCILTNLEMKNFEKEKDKKLRDWQVAQLLLPCFVASYNNLCKVNPPIDEDMKFWYANFILNLIAEYLGKNGIRKSSWKNIKKDIDENSVLKDDAKLLDFIENVIESFKNQIKQFPNQIGAFVKFCPIWDSLYEVLSMKNSSGSSQNEDISSEPSIYWNWLMWDFFSKMKHAISVS